MAILLWSDLHVDYGANRERLAALPRDAHRDDALLLAGDVTHDLDRLATAFDLLRQRFARVFFVPGNHELWVRGGGAADSREKLEQVLSRCGDSGIETEPARVDGHWVVPLFSWYVRPEQGGDSLFLPKPGEDAERVLWSDDLFVRWPTGVPPLAEHMAARNAERLARRYDAPVVSFSHFLPRRDLMFRAADEPAVVDRNPAFNFSRVAGDAGLDRVLRALGSIAHGYGHQHRNRCRDVDGVRYVSQCLGYPGEAAGDGPRRVA